MTTTAATRRDQSGGRGSARSRYLGKSVGRPAAPDPAEEAERLREERGRRYRLLYAIWRVTSLPQTAFCARYLHGGADFATVQLRDGRAGWGGLRSCKSIHACPRCSPVIRQRRYEQIERLGLAHAKAGGGLGFLTVTLPHTKADPLADSLDTVLNGWRAVQQSRAVRSLFTRLGVLGSIRATEITRGYRGWHPHTHLLMFTTRPLTAAELAEIEEAVYKAWARYVARRGYGAPSREHGVVMRPVDMSRGTDGLSAYLAKVHDAFGKSTTIALEMARGDLKRGRKGSRTPFEIAESAAAGHGGDLKLWHEYEAATKGRSVIYVPPKLSALYGVEDVTDDQAVEEAESAPAVAALDAAEYALVVRYRACAAMLTAAELRGGDAVYERLRALIRRDRVDAARAARKAAASP
ncbi:MAG TPA: hypothetical protein VNU01_12625 [Egibacteraceae bacterium]|nr:hypothetical protein [Egibacteraceae bacterium]